MTQWRVKMATAADTVGCKTPATMTSAKAGMCTMSHTAGQTSLSRARPETTDAATASASKAKKIAKNCEWALSLSIGGKTPYLWIRSTSVEIVDTDTKANRQERSPKDQRRDSLNLSISGR